MNQEQDEIEIQATRSLQRQRLFESLNRDTTPDLQGFITKLQNLIPFAGEEIAHYLRESIAAIQKAKEALQQGETEEAMYNFTNAYRIIDTLRAKEASLEARFSLPYPRNPSFTGREIFLSETYAQLQQTKRATLAGPGGIGKTEIAREYTFRFGDEYQAIFWVDASRVSRSDSDILDLAIALHEQRERRWLLVVDTVVDFALIETLVPKEPHNGHVLITTRVAVTGPT